MKQTWPTRNGTERGSYAPLECGPRGGPYVYFLGTADGRYIKVGFSGQDDWGRIKQHMKGDAFGFGGDLTVLAVVRAATGRDCERAVLKYFAAYAVPDLPKKETFYAEALIPYVTWLRDLYFVTATEEDFHKPVGRTVVESLAWLPGEGRVSTRRRERDLLTVAEPWGFLPPRRHTVGDDWYTPLVVLEAAREALGGTIDLDPASHVIANTKVQATQYFTIDQDGLCQPWYGTVWLNPPYSAWPFWAEKALAEADAGRVDAMIFFCASRQVSTQYLRALIARADAVCIVTGRLAAWGIAAGDSGAPDGVHLFYIGRDVERFRAAMEPELGVCFLRPAAWMAATDA